MEMEYSQFMLQEKLEFLDILKVALTIPLKNINCFIFTVFTSLPFFCFLVFFQIVLQKTLLETCDYLEQSRYFSDYYYFYWHDESQRVNLPYLLIPFCVLYLVPYHLLELLNIIITVDTAAMIFAGEKPVSLRDLISKPLKRKIKGPFITSLYVLFFSTCFLVGLVGVVTNCLIMNKGSAIFSYYHYNMSFFASLCIAICHGVAFVALLMKYLEWSAGWNMGLVVSVLEEAYGSEALEVSAYFSRGSGQRGLLLMLFFFVWELFFRLPCLSGGCHERFGGVLFTSVLTSFIWVGSVMKWVALVVYFFDCKSRVLEKKVDEEVGRKVKAVGS